MSKLTAANVAHNQAVEHALHEIITQSDLDTALAEIAALSAPTETATVDLDDLGSDAIAVLGDGSVLCWGNEHRINGRTYRDIVVAGGAEDGHGVMNAELQAEIWEDSQVCAD